uniref:Uncharacterized protein n=1 Tax=Cacopsylla melanoneura TaxID=428564 RepID=A0A8D8XMM4_9HEMI
MMLRLYHALGNARISVRRRMSYLNEADPMSTMVENRMVAPLVCSVTFLLLDRCSLTNSTLTLRESLRSVSERGEKGCWALLEEGLTPLVLALDVPAVFFPPYG